jgi:hypothetical protein
VSIASYEPLFIDLGLLVEEVGDYSRNPWNFRNTVKIRISRNNKRKQNKKYKPLGDYP